MIQKKASGGCKAIIFVLAIALPTIFVTNFAEAFSLGKIRVTGAFDKQFKAEIPARTDGREDLFVVLGKYSDYRRVGVERPEFLDSLIIHIADHPTVPQQKIIYITSPTPIYDPSFNLIIKAKLGRGVILENYFLAVDFQQNLAMETESEEKRLAMAKVAEEMKALRSGLTTPKPLEEEAKKEPLVEPDQEDPPKRLSKQTPKPEVEPRPEPDYANMSKREAIEAIRAEEEAAEAEKEFFKPEPVIITKSPKVVEKTTVAALPQRPKPTKTIAPTPKPEPEIKLEPEPTPTPEPVKRVVPATAKKPVIQKEAPVVIKSSVVPASSTLTFAEPPGDVQYEVVSGDSLYKIVKKFQANRMERDRIVAAIWLENKSRFIKGNIHGIRRGVVLDMAEVIATAKNLSDDEAQHIIKSQWGEWKTWTKAPTGVVATKIGGGKKPTTKIAIAANKIPFRDAALSALADWEADNNTELNLSEAFMKKGNNGVIDVKVPLADNGKSKPGQVATFKLAKNNGRLTVIDQTLPDEKKPTAKKATVKKPEEAEKKPASYPYVVHVASFKKLKSAEEMVRLLRLKGYNAYNALKVVPGKGNWHRVAIDRFSGLGEAKDFAGSIKSSGILSYTRILKLPYAVLIDEKALAQNRKEAIKTLGEAGVSAYTTDGVKENLLLAGAFANKKAAADAQAIIAKKGFHCRVITP